MDYHRGKTPLGMHCPHCGEWGEHPVTRTHDKWFYHSDKATRILTELFGRDVKYRRRTKRCTRCKRTFDSAELDCDFLNMLINQIVRWSIERTEASVEIAALKKALADHRNTLRTIRKLTLKTDTAKS